LKGDKQMRRSCFSFAYAVLLCCVFASSVAAAPFSLLGGSSPQPQEAEFVIAPSSIRIHVAERPLGQVLARVQRESGITFDIPQRLLRVPITVRVEAADWPTAIKRLLHPFNRAERWNRLDQLVHVTVVERGEALEDLRADGAEDLRGVTPEGEVSETGKHDGHGDDTALLEQPITGNLLHILSALPSVDPEVIESALPPLSR
jgi:hypothetical protein